MNINCQCIVKHKTGHILRTHMLCKIGNLTQSGFYSISGWNINYCFYPDALNDLLTTELILIFRICFGKIIWIGIWKLTRNKVLFKRRYFCFWESTSRQKQRTNFITEFYLSSCLRLPFPCFHITLFRIRSSCFMNCLPDHATSCWVFVSRIDTDRWNNKEKTLECCVRACITGGV